MRKELSVSPVILAFDDLDEIIVEIDAEIELHKKMLARYGDRLGVLLRNNNNNAAGSEFPQQVPQERQEQSERNSSKNRRREVDDGGWMSIESEEFTLKVATTSLGSSPSSYEVAQLFKITEALKTKVTALEIAKKFLNELPSKGFRADQRFFVVFREGIPRQVIPTNESRAQMRRFRYAEQFELSVLE